MFNCLTNQVNLIFHNFFSFHRIVAGPRKDDMDEQGDDNVFADITNKQLFKSPTPKKTAKLTELQPDDEENEEVQKHSNLPTNFKKSPTTVKD